VHYIPYQKLEDKSKSGEDWAVHFSELQGLIDEHLGMTDLFDVKEIEYPTRIQILSFQKLGVSIPWWETLSELTSSFNDTSAHHMNSADKQLRQTAQELFNLSNKVLSNY
jgi:hypothetical protein